MWFTVKKINKNIWGIGEFKHPEEVISYLILGKKRTLLFDTGLGIENIQTEVKKITSMPVVVINSHSHFDHVGGNHLFKKILNPKKTKSIALDPFKFKIIKAPGHSPDSICLYESKKQWLFSGDTLYPGPIYLHLRESSLSDYKKTLKKLLKLKISKIFPAHNDFYFPKKNLKRIYQIISTKKILQKREKIDDKTSLLLK
jgi:glyoxylase-like metal-dependent hydrolase (beta-lactamase superfamily II)